MGCTISHSRGGGQAHFSQCHRRRGGNSWWTASCDHLPGVRWFRRTCRLHYLHLMLHHPDYMYMLHHRDYLHLMLHHHHYLHMMLHHRDYMYMLHHNHMMLHHLDYMRMLHLHSG